MDKTNTQSTVSFPGSRFSIDYPDYLSQYAIVCESPIRHGYDGLLTGGGDTTAVVWMPDTLTVMINKSDILTPSNEERRQKDPTKAEDPSKGQSSQAYDECNPIHAAKIRFLGTEEPLTEYKEFKAVQEVYDGIITVNSVTDDNTLKLTVRGDANTNIIEFNCESEKGLSGLAFQMSRTINPDYGTDLKSGSDDNRIWLLYHGVDGRHYGVAVLLATGSGECVSDGAGETKIVLSGNDARILLAVVNCDETEDVLKEAWKKLDEYVSKTPEQMLTEHRQWWQYFWAKSFIHTSQYYLNNLWYIYHYQLAIASRGTYPMKFNRGSFNWRDDDKRGWGGPFWSLNQARTYAGLFNSDHMDLIDNMYRLVEEHLPEARENTKMHFDIDGIWMPETLHPWKGGAPGLHSGKKIKDCIWEEDGGGPDVWMRTPAAQWALLFWRRYQLTQDQRFLREQVYPLLKGTADFYAAYVVKGDDGKYHTHNSMAIEQPPVGDDSITDLSCIQWLFPATIEACQVLQQDLNDIPTFEEILDNLAPYPVWNGRYTYINYQGEPFPLENTPLWGKDKGKTAKQLYMWQSPYNYPVYPWGVVGMDSSPEEYDAMAEIYWRYRFHMDFGSADPTLPAARLGLKDEAYRQLHRIITTDQNMKQGLFVEHADTHYGSQKLKEEGFIPYFNAAGAFAQLVNEIFLQGHRGIIDAFIAFPDEWEGAFSLLCERGFFVSGQTFREGEILYLAIESRNGGTCRIRNPWQGLPHVFNEDGKTVSFTTDEEIIEFATEANNVYIVEPNPGAYQKVDPMIFKAELNAEPKMLGHAVLGTFKHSPHHAQTWSVW